MFFVGWKRSLFAVPLMLVLIPGDGCGMIPRPTIKVSIGMTVEQLRAGSTYPFKAEAPGVLASPSQKVPYPVAPPLHDWVINEPYDLVYLYKGRSLREGNLGGDNYLLAITTGSETKKIIDHIQITFQNKALTLDEALSVAKRLNDWFVAAGFHPRSAMDHEMGRVVSPFYIEGQERAAPRYGRTIANYHDAAGAFLDPQAKIIGITPFELETDDAYASLEIVNARRQREDTGDETDERDARVEREYFLDLSITARPTDRYSDIMAARRERAIVESGH